MYNFRVKIQFINQDGQEETIVVKKSASDSVTGSIEVLEANKDKIPANFKINVKRE